MIALNMEDGTLHRFRAASTILATGVVIIQHLLLILAIPNLTLTSNSTDASGLW